MKKIILLAIVLSTFSFGQKKISKNHPVTNLTCKTCHSCDVPTKQDPCLNACPRASMVTVYQPAGKTKNVVTLGEISKKYEPVIFQHRIHAEMAEMSGGCATCHHYNTSGPIQPCKNCHLQNRKRDDISKPDLEAAYHRQCITCHREWSHQNSCVSCHALKNSVQSSSEMKRAKALEAKTHPKLVEPKKIVFETNDKDGKLVTFFHDEHINLFGAKCIDCHQQQNCSQCHDKGNANMVNNPEGMPIKMQKSKAEHHKPCFTCHQNDNCSLCHKDKVVGSFNHEIRTGWALNRFHAKLSCTKCHGTSYKFTKLDNKCVSCHKDWKAGSFKHEITGLKLDKNHTDADCGDCHINKDFSKPPSCSNCHEDKSFPKDKPGILITGKRR